MIERTLEKTTNQILPKPEPETLARQTNKAPNKVQDAEKPKQVVGPLGEALTKADLPPRNTSRWVIRRKAEVVFAVNGGLLTQEEACERYNLSLEEFICWQQAIHRSGMPGLRVTHLQDYRDKRKYA